MEQTSWRHITALLLSMSTSLVRDPELAPLLGSRYSLGDQLCPQAAPKEAQSEDKRDQGRHFRGRWGPTAGVSHPRATCGNWAAGPQPHRAGDRFALSSPLAAGQESQTEAALNLGRAEGRGRWAVGGACAQVCRRGHWAVGRGLCAPGVQAWTVPPGCAGGDCAPHAVQAGTVTPRLCRRGLYPPGRAGGDCSAGATALSGRGALLPSSSKAGNSRCPRCLLRRFHDGRSRGHVHRPVAGMSPGRLRTPGARGQSRPALCRTPAGT